MNTVLITGANSGLGRELVRIFLTNNWYVIACSRKPAEVFAEFSPNKNFLNFSLDITDQQSIRVLASKLKGKSIDVLINCAGVYDGPADDTTIVSTIPEITNVFLVNTIGAKVLTDILLPNLQKGTEKLVVTISSEMGTYAKLDDYNARHWAYSASKIAVNYAMLAFNTEHPEIKCALIHPGWMKTNIGGLEASLDPSFSAEKIFELIINHTTRLRNGILVDYEGRTMEF